MPSEDLGQWFDAYIEAFAACGRGERAPESLLDHYDPPLLLTTDDVCVRLPGDGEVLEWIKGQVDGMRAADFSRIEVLDRDIEPLNATTTLIGGSFARRRSDGSEIARLDVTYLVVERSGDPSIAALIVHGQPG